MKNTGELWHVAIVSSLIAFACYMFAYALMHLLAPSWVETIFWTFFDCYWVVYVILFILPYIPGQIKALANDPNRKNPDGTPYQTNPEFGFFVFLEQGRVVLVERGKSFMRALMDFADHDWLGERDNELGPRQPKYWDVEESGKVVAINPDGTPRDVIYHDTHPIPFPVKSISDVQRRWWWVLYAPFSIHLWVWKRHVYKVTGGVFTGIYPFQGPRVHKVVYMKKKILANGEIELVPTESWSNHLRVSDFELMFIIPKSDTKDLAAVSITVSLILRVYNPHKTAYRTDGDFVGRVGSILYDTVTRYTRSKRLEKVLAATNDAGAGELADTIKTTGDRKLTVEDPDGKNVTSEAPLCAIGIEIVRAQVPDISPFDSEMAASLSKLATASYERKADEEKAVGRAAYTKELRKVAEGDPNAAVYAEVEGRVRMAQAMAGGNNPGNIVILGGGQNYDPVQLAQLNALRENNRRR